VSTSNLRRIRQERGLSLRDLARLSGIADHASLSRIERGVTQPPIGTIMRLSAGLSIPVGQLAELMAADWADREQVAS
jgi:XRE family transcriptional regulator, regulator of sulfur utilization